MIHPGTLVYLKSGGPKMTAGKRREDDKVYCSWFDKDQVLRESFFIDEQLVVVG